MNAQDKAKFARQLYYARMGEVDKAFSEPSPESLQAWVIVVDTVEKMGNPKSVEKQSIGTIMNDSDAKHPKT